MSWEGDTAFRDLAEPEPGRDAEIELVGASLRLTGHIKLGKFGRLTDLVNALRGYVTINDAQLLRPDGAPTGLAMPELMVDEDEISFIAQTADQHPENGPATGFVDQAFAQPQQRVARRYLMFTPGHAVTGTVYLFGETGLRGFVDATDPRYIAVTDATARSLADPAIVCEYP